MICIHVPHEHVDIIVDFELVLEISSDKSTQKSVTRRYELFVLWVIISLTINSHFDYQKCNVSNIERLEQTLILSVWRRITIINMENQKFFQFVLAILNLLSTLVSNLCLFPLKSLTCIHCRDVNHSSTVICISFELSLQLGIITLCLSLRAIPRQLLKYPGNLIFSILSSLIMLRQPKLYL